MLVDGRQDDRCAVDAAANVAVDRLVEGGCAAACDGACAHGADRGAVGEGGVMIRGDIVGVGTALVGSGPPVERDKSGGEVGVRATLNI